MLRILPSLLALSAAMLLAAPAIAADVGGGWGDDSGDQGDNSGALRTGYPTQPGDWAGLGDKDDPLTFEFGARYWYSIGAANWSDGAGSFTTTDNSQIAEGHLRIEDHSTNTYASLLGGLSFSVNGTFADPNATGTVSGGHVAYLGADFGWNSWGDNKGSGVGPLIGYLYWNDSPYTSRAGYTTATSAEQISYDPTTGQTTLPMSSSPNDVNMNMLRLGVQGKGDLGFFDITGSLAAVPYAKVSGVLGDDQTTTTFMPSGNVHTIKGSPTDINGWGYGAMADLMLRAHPTSNWTIGVGGRAWYLTGTVDATFDEVTTGDPGVNGTPPPAYNAPPPYARQSFIEMNNPFSLMRYGVLAEATYNF